MGDMVGKRLEEIAQILVGSNKKAQLIYAFNGTGKTRLSREFTKLVRSSGNDLSPDSDLKELGDNFCKKILYYNAFTEDLFYWANDFEETSNIKLKIHPNVFTDWIIQERGDREIINNFQRYTTGKLTPFFNEREIVKEGKRQSRKTYPEVSFSYATGDRISDNVKISKGEESIFIWSIFFTLIQEVVEALNEPDTNMRVSNDFDELQYVFIDDPVSSLDEEHLIELAIDLAELIKTSNSELQFVIATHNPLFYNVMSNELE